MGHDVGNYVWKTIGGGLVSLMVSFFHHQFRTTRRKEALEIGKQLLDITVASHEAGETTPAASTEANQKFAMDISAIREAVYSEFRRNDATSIELLPKRIPVKVLILRFLLGSVI